LRPVEIAVLLLPGGDEQPPVKVMDATDQQFQAFIASAGIPVDEAGITEWSFDDRCGIINHAIRYGVSLPFVDPLANKNNSESEQKEFGNNSETIHHSELFVPPAQA
jgi:hypothetical protein